MDIEGTKEHGWNDDLTLKWHNEAYPQDVTDLLYRNDERGGDDIESDDEYDNGDDDNDILDEDENDEYGT